MISMEQRSKQTGEAGDEKRKRTKTDDEPTKIQKKKKKMRKRKYEGLSEEAKQDSIRRRKEMNSRDVSFSKRRKGLFNKTEEFCMMFDRTLIAIVVLSRAQRPYAFGHPSVDAVLDHYLLELQQSSPTSDFVSTLGHALQQQTLKFEELKAKLKSRQHHHDQLCNTSSTTVVLDVVKEQIDMKIKACQTLQDLVSLRQNYLVLLDNIKSRNSSENSWPLLEHHQAAEDIHNFGAKPIISPDGRRHGDITVDGAGDGSDETVEHSNLGNLSFREDLIPLAPTDISTGPKSSIRLDDYDQDHHNTMDLDSIANFLFNNDVVEGTAGGPSGGAATDCPIDTAVVETSGLVEQQDTNGVYSSSYYLQLQQLLHKNL